MTSYLVAGASRGIGQELVHQLASKSSTSVVYAGVRNITTAPPEFLSNPKIQIIALDVLSQKDVDNAVGVVEKMTGSLDILIVNAGATAGTTAVRSSVAELEAMLSLNTIAPYRIIKAFLPLVRAGQQKKIVAIGTGGGSFGIARPVAKEGLPVGVYGVSKAALHFLMMLYGAELAADGILCAAINPGLVETEGSRAVMENAGKEVQDKFAAMGVTAISKVECAEGLIQVIGSLNVEESGSLLAWNGKTIILPY